MGLINADLKVLIIGNDGIMRAGYCDRQSKFAYNKYRLDADAVFLTEKYLAWIVPWGVQPTILFRENNTEPIFVKDVETSSPTPEETGDAISSASVSLARLLMEKDKMLMVLAVIFAAMAFVAAAGGIYMTYKFESKFDASQASAPSIIVPTGTPVPYTFRPTVTPTPIITLTPTIKPTVTPTGTYVPPPA